MTRTGSRPACSSCNRPSSFIPPHDHQRALPASNEEHRQNRTDLLPLSVERPHDCLTYGKRRRIMQENCGPYVIPCSSCGFINHLPVLGPRPSVIRCGECGMYITLDDAPNAAPEEKQPVLSRREVSWGIVASCVGTVLGKVFDIAYDQWKQQREPRAIRLQASVKGTSSTGRVNITLEPVTSSVPV
jgi:hypothetical protein